MTWISDHTFVIHTILGRIYETLFRNTSLFGKIYECWVSSEIPAIWRVLRRWASLEKTRTNIEQN